MASKNPSSGPSAQSQPDPTGQSTSTSSGASSAAPSGGSESGQGRPGAGAGGGDREMGIATTREGGGGTGTDATRGGQGQSGTVQGPGHTNPFTLMRRLSEEMDRMFGDFGFGGVGLFPDVFGLGNARSRLGRSTAEPGQSLWSPAVDVFQRDNNLVVHAELPGVAPDDVNVEVTDDTLVVSGQRQSQRQSGQGGTYRSERSYGSFYRAIPLPENIDPNSVQASFHNGVLEIEIPMPQQQSRSRKIPVRGD